MDDHEYVVLDDTAMVAAGRGNQKASLLIRRALLDDGISLYATTCALVEADRVRPGTAEHIASISAVDILSLDLPAALAVAAESTWAFAHTRYAASPTLDRPQGAAVATGDPDRWFGMGLSIIDVRPQ